MTNNMEQYKISNILARLLAITIDVLLILGIFLKSITFILVADAYNTFEVIIAVIPVFYLIFIFKDIVGGRSIGKRIAGLKVIANDGKVPSIFKLIARNLFMPFIFIDVFIVLVRRDQKKIGDILGKSNVYAIKEYNGIKRLIANYAVIIILLLYSMTTMIGLTHETYAISVKYIKDNIKGIKSIRYLSVNVYEEYAIVEAKVKARIIVINNG